MATNQFESVKYRLKTRLILWVVVEPNRHSSVIHVFILNLRDHALECILGILTTAIILRCADFGRHYGPIDVRLRRAARRSGERGKDREPRSATGPRGASVHRPALLFEAQPAKISPMIAERVRPRCKGARGFSQLKMSISRLQNEDGKFDLLKPKEMKPLYILAISAKRYALANIVRADGSDYDSLAELHADAANAIVIVRKVSAHAARTDHRAGIQTPSRRPRTFGRSV